MPSNKNKETLSRVEQIIEYGVKALRTELKDHPNVMGVGFGLKRTQGELLLRKSRKPIPCLKVYVYRKGDFDHPDDEIASRFEFEVDGHRRIVPTDVEAVEVAKTEGRNIRSSPIIQGNRKQGSFAGVLKRPGEGEIYLLTARHVVTDILPAEVEWNVEKPPFPGRGRGSGRLPLDMYYKDPDTGVSGFFDAAVVQIVEKELLVDSTQFAWSDEVLSWPEVQEPRDVYVCGANGVRSARFSKVVETGWPIKTRLGLVGYWRMVCYELQGGLTSDGDSGAPVITVNDGKLVGIHVARKGRFIFAMPAVDVLKKMNDRLESSDYSLAKFA